MLFFNLICGLLLGVLAMALYALSFSVRMSGKAGGLLYKHSKNHKGVLSFTAGSVGKGINSIGNLSGSTLKTLGTVSLLASGTNILIAGIEFIMAIVLLVTLTSPASIASTIIHTGGDADTAKAVSVSHKDVNTAQASNASGKQKEILDYAQSFVGKVPYVWGGSSPSGWDCSGFTLYVFAHFGINLGVHNDAAQANVAKSWGATDDPKNPKPGDLMRVPGHVAIYLGNGMLVEAASPQLGTRVTKVYNDSRGPWEYYDIIDHHR